MSNKIKPQDNNSNQKNSNSGTSGKNPQYKAKVDNRANQLNPNHKKTK
jgi:hypothetical protein